MTTHFLNTISRVLPTVLVACALSSVAYAQSANARLYFRNDLVTTPLVPLHGKVDYTCIAPATPAKIDLPFDLGATSFDLSPFLQSEGSARKIVVRRGGQIQQGQTSESSKARFTKRFFSKEEQSQIVDLTLRPTLFVCDYKGFLEFVRFDLSLEGQVGNFGVNVQKSFTADETAMQYLLYSSRGWTSDEGGRFVPMLGFRHLNQSDDIMGELTLSAELEAIPFRLTGGESQILVDVDLYGTIYVAGAKP